MMFVIASDFFRARTVRCLSRLVLWALCALLAGSSATTHAQNAEGRTPPQEAVEHYNRGRAFYQEGRYREAVVELERALTLDPSSPNLVYNVARVYELLGEIDKSIVYYRRYQAMLPASEHEERERIAGVLQRLEGAKQHTDTSSSAAQPAPAKPQLKRGVADPTFWVFASTAGAALAGGAVTGVLALNMESQAQGFVIGKDGNASERARQVDRADKLALSSDVLLLVGTTLAVTSLLLYMLREQPVEPLKRARFGIGASAQAAVLTFEGSL